MRRTKTNPAGDDFTFIVTADVHFGAFAQSRTWLEKMIAEVNAMDPLPAFILNCGDETERGWESFGYNDLWVEGTSFYSISFGGTFAEFDLSGSTPTEQWRTLTGFQSVNSGLVLFDSQLLVGGFKDGGPAAIHGNLIAINPATRAVASHSIAPEGWIFSMVGVGDGFAYLGALG